MLQNNSYQIASLATAASSTYLICARDILDGIYEATDDGLCDGLTMFRQPRAQRGHKIDCLFSLIDQSFLLFDLQRRFNALHEFNRQGIALMDIRNIAVKAGFGIIVGQEADVVEFPAEDVDDED